MSGAAYEILPLSGSADGRGLKITPTTAGTAATVHQVSNNAVDLDMIDILAYNSHTAGATLTLCVGGTTNPDDLISQYLPNGAGLIVVAERLILRNNLILKAFADVANVIVLFGRVYRVDKQ